MSANDRTERVVRAWLAESVEPPRVPDYLPDLIALTAQTSQRPAWTLPERWFSMATLTRVQATFAPVPWRAMALLALLLALVGGALIYTAARPTRLPEPFGPAANGLVAYDWAGDIYTVNPETGAATAITTGVAQDREPVFSRDGSRIVFERLVDGEISLVSVDADGGDEIALDGRYEEGAVSFSPDGRAVLARRLDQAVVVVPTDGSAARVVAPGYGVQMAIWRPASDQVLFVGGLSHTYPGGLYLADDAVIRELVPPSQSPGAPIVSPDGRRVAYTATKGDDRLTARVLTVDTGDIEEFDVPQGVAWPRALGWSNDGGSIALERWYDGGRTRTLAIVPSSDLSAAGVEAPRGLQLEWIEWAPDDSAILATQVDEEGHRTDYSPVLIDPLTGDVRPAPWDTAISGSWQRVAP